MSAVGLNMKFTADTGGIKAGASETSKLLSGLTKDVGRAQDVFSQFAGSNSAAAAAQQQLATDAAFLASALRTGQISADEFKAELAELSSAAAQQASAFQQGAALTEQYTSAEQKRANEIARLDSLLQAGAISEETYAAAMFDASGAADEAAAAEQAKSKAMSRASSIVESTKTKEEKYADTTEELSDLLKQGYLSQEQFNRAMDKAKRELDGVEKAAGDATGVLKSMSGSLKIIAGIEIGRLLVDAFRSITSSIGGMVSAVRQSIDATAKLAKQTGIAVEELQVFQLAAQMSGVDNLVEPIRKLGVMIGQAAESGKTDAFTKLGLDFDKLSAMSPEEQFKAVSAAIAAIPDQAARAAAAVKIFGEQGVKLLPLFESNLAAVQERMERLGIVLSGTQTQAIEDMNDTLLLVQKTFEGIIGQVTANLAPAVTAIAEEFLSFVEGYQGLGDGTGGTALADSITTALFDGAEYLADLLDSAVMSLSDWGASVEDVFAGLATTFQFFYDAAVFLNDAFYFVRSVFNDFLSMLASWAASFVGFFSSEAAEFMKTFSSELARSAEEDRGRMSRDAAPRAQGARVFGDAVKTGREAYEGRNSPEAKAAREQAKADREKQKQAAKAAQEEAARQKQLEDLQKQRDKERADREKKIGDLTAQLFEKAEEFEQNRLDALSRANQQALEVSDLRSGGISQFLALATGREDPAVAEARAQRKELEKIAAEIRKLGGTVELVGAA